ncbi:uncharacterized protein LOC125436834 [Sphaerodactylus townsendi]|uniref:uncharacterized protein LOC125436834 n=1 Tax=Sphaerodactylus townsendi TaxID=933632 RepID=UPI002025DEA3|nr:uncharacterized protein LOC125436834 [Sphaerodactylus townsendi]
MRIHNPLSHAASAILFRFPTLQKVLSSLHPKEPLSSFSAQLFQPGPALIHLPRHPGALPSQQATGRERPPQVAQFLGLSHNFAPPTGTHWQVQGLRAGVLKMYGARKKKEDVKGVKKKEETKDEAETPAGSPTLRTAVDPHPAPKHKEKKNQVREKKHQRPLTGPPSPTSKIPTPNTVTAQAMKKSWEDRRKASRFSSLLLHLSEENLDAEEAEEEEAVEPPKEELQDLAPRSSLHKPVTAHDKKMPVNLSALSPNQPQPLPAVETVEPQPRGLQDRAPSTFRDVQRPTIQSSVPSSKSRKENLASAHSHQTGKGHSASNKNVAPNQEAMPRKGTFPFIWKMAHRLSHWKTAHQRRCTMDREKRQKSTIMKHERDTKTSVPLPLQEVIEEEALEILKETLKDYQKHLGATHELTLQLEEKAEKLHLRLKGRGVID